MKYLIEIRAAEGGEDSKLFVNDLADAYVLFAKLHGHTWKVQNLREGYAEISITGNNLKPLENEAGGHRIQRVPPTESKGRVHTSSVTVAVIPEGQSKTRIFSDNEFRVEWFSGTGKGGQHRNKKQNSCRVIHIPTGLVETRQGRVRESNYKDAKKSLEQKIQENYENKVNCAVAQNRKQQVGSGMRGDKIRTYRFRDNIVSDHVSGKKASCNKVMKGKFELLW